MPTKNLVIVQAKKDGTPDKRCNGTPLNFKKTN